MNERRCTGRLLLGKNGDVEAKDKKVQTPLLWAAKNKYSAGVRMLRDREANIQAKDIDGRTALHWMAEWGREVVSRLLLERNADVETKDKMVERRCYRPR